MVIKLLILTFLYLLFGVRLAFAEFTFTVPETTISFNEVIETTITLSLQGQGNKTYYLEGAFKKDGASNYFGLTWNDISWAKYTASQFTTLKSINTDSIGKWNGSIKVKLDNESGLFTGDGIYTLRLKRFTEGGSSAWSDNTITLNITSSTPTPAPSPLSTPTPSLTSSSSSFTISNITSQINSDQSFNVSVNLSLPNNPDTTYYLSGAFKIVNGTRYFGLTKKDFGWVQYSSASFSNQYKITTNSSGSWAGNLEVKPDIEDSDYKGSGDYIFKVGRYTSTGSGPTWSNESNIQITALENTDQGGIPSDTSSTTVPSSSPPSEQSAKSKTASGKSKSYDRLDYHSATVAAATTKSDLATTSASPSPSAQIKGTSVQSILPWIGATFIFCGISSLIFIYLRSRKIL